MCFFWIHSQFIFSPLYISSLLFIFFSLRLSFSLALYIFPSCPDPTPELYYPWCCLSSETHHHGQLYMRTWKKLCSNKGLCGKLICLKLWFCLWIFALSLSLSYYFYLSLHFSFFFFLSLSLSVSLSLSLCLSLCITISLSCLDLTPELYHHRCCLSSETYHHGPCALEKKASF